MNNSLIGVEGFLIDMDDIAAIGPLESMVLEESITRYRFRVFFKGGATMLMKNPDRRVLAAALSRLRVAWSKYRGNDLLGPEVVVATPPVFQRGEVEIRAAEAQENTEENIEEES